MGKKKFSSSGSARPALDLPSARKQVRDRIQQLVREWRQQNSTLVARAPGQITFFNDFMLRRQANGSIKLLGPEGTSPIVKEMGLSEPEIREWLVRVGNLKIQLLVVDELRRLTGKKHLGLRDLGSVSFHCIHSLHLLCTDENEKGDGLSPLVQECIGFLDPEILELTRSARDTKASLATYNLISANLPLWKAMTEQTPHLMPLVSLACRNNYIRFDTNVFRSLKAYGKRYGLTEAGWKMLCRFSGEHIRILMQHPLQDCFRMASYYGETGQIPQIQMLLAHISLCRVRGLPFDAIPAWFDAAAMREYARQEQALTFAPPGFVHNEYYIAQDWLSHYIAEGGEPDANQKKAGWQWIMRQSDEWHEAMLEEQARKSVITNHKWTSALGAYQDNGYEVIPLLSSADLAIEGARMHHCVGSYDHYCREGRSRIFSIRKAGKRLATAELVKLSHGWSLNQNRGPCNNDPDAEIKAVAKRLEERYNEATLLLPK